MEISIRPGKFSYDRRAYNLPFINPPAVPEGNGEPRQVIHAGKHETVRPPRNIITERSDYARFRFPRTMVTLGERVRHRNGWAKGGAVHPQRFEETITHLIGVRPAVNLFDEKPDDVKTGIRIGEDLSGLGEEMIFFQRSHVSR